MREIPRQVTRSNDAKNKPSRSEFRIARPYDDIRVPPRAFLWISLAEISRKYFITDARWRQGVSGGFSCFLRIDPWTFHADEFGFLAYNLENDIGILENICLIAKDISR